MLTEGSGIGQHSFDRNPTESLVAVFGRVIRIDPMRYSMALSDQLMDLVRNLRLLDICKQIVAAQSLWVAVTNPFYFRKCVVSKRIKSDFAQIK